MKKALKKGLSLLLVIFCCLTFCLGTAYFVFGFFGNKTGNKILNKDASFATKGEYKANMFVDTPNLLSEDIIVPTENESVSLVETPTYIVPGHEAKAMLSRDEKYLLIVAGIDDVTAYNDIGFSIFKDGETLEQKHVGKYYEGISVKTSETERTTYLMTDIFDQDVKGMIVYELSDYDATAIYQIQPFYTQLAEDCETLYGAIRTTKKTATSHIYEFENAIYTGVSNSKDHACVGSSFEFNTGFSGNVCLKNIATSATMTFVIESDKNVEVPLDIRLSRGYVGGKTLEEALSITDGDGKSLTDMMVTIPSTGGEVPSGASTSYFTMVTVSTTISLTKGENTIVFQNKTAGVNLDYINIRTAAMLTDKTHVKQADSSWGDIAKQSTIVAPTETAAGSIKFTCPTDSAAITKTLPALTDSCYAKTEGTEKDVYGLTVAGQTLTIAESYLLTLRGATFEDNTTAKKVFVGTTPELSYTAPANQVLDYWYNAAEETETYGTEFTMPAKSLTIAPKYRAEVEYTLTLENAKFADNGSVRKSLAEGTTFAESDIQITVPEGKKFVGWYDVETRELFSANRSFNMPARNVTLAPVFDAETYFYADKTYVGKIKPTGHLYGGREKDCYSVKTADITGAVKNESGGFELGGIYHFKGGTADDPAQMAVGSYFLTQDMNGWHSNVSNLPNHTVTITVENFGSEDVTLRFALITSSGNPNSQYGEKIVTIKAGESVTFTFDVTYLHGSFMTNVMVKDHAVGEVHIGMYQYISVAE